MTIPYQKQSDPQVNRGCGAACLSMVYQSFGKDVPQAEIWPLIAKQNRQGSIASTAYLMTQHALGQGLSAVALQARHPLQVLRLCRDGNIRAILNHRLQPDSTAGHFSVLVDIDDTSVVLHDPLFGPSRRLTYAELLPLWHPQSANSEISGNVVIGIAEEPPELPACEYCHTTIPTAIDCPRCKKAVSLRPGSLLGCIRDGCIARMWNFVSCPFCDFTWSFNEAGKSTAEFTQPEAPKPSSGLPPVDIEKVFADVEKFCAFLLTVPGAAEHADLAPQLSILRATKDKFKAAQVEKAAYCKAEIDRMTAFQQSSEEKIAAHRKKVEEMKTPPPALDGNALGAALLKNLGFK